jgi:hypothetical protein
MFANSYFKMLPFVVDYIGSTYFLKNALKCFKSFSAVLLCSLKICQLLAWPSFREGPDPNLDQR